MFPSTLGIPIFLTFLTLFILLAFLKGPNRHKDDRKQPPGPLGLPVIGHLHMLGEFPHRTLQTLAKTYGPIISLRLGQVPTIVLSSPEAAELFLKPTDALFASRPRLQASEHFSYGSKGLVFSEYGPYWRSMRKLCTLNLLTASKVESFGPLRVKEVEEMVKVVQKAAMVGKVVDLTEVVHDVLENMVYKMVLGCDNKKDYGFDLKGLIEEEMNLFGAFNLADYVPWLGVFDFQGLTKRFKKTSKALDEVLEKIINDHEQAPNDTHHKDFIDILLSLMHQNDTVSEDQFKVDRTNIKAIALDMIAGAFETSAIIIVWALSELLRHPRVMEKLQHELQAVIGTDNLVHEKDLGKLNYLEMVIKETFRLHPAGPLLPREAIEDVRVGEYFVKKKTRIILNVWAMGRDTKVWSENAEEFLPERFSEMEVDFRGRDSLMILPFGSGRRGCPGLLLGLCTVKLVLAQLVHCFDWELPWAMGPQDLDMTEKFGLSLPKAQHLLAVPTCRVRISNEIGL